MKNQIKNFLARQELIEIIEANNNGIIIAKYLAKTANCEFCHEPFIKIHGTQKYCKPKCGSAASTRKFREKKRSTSYDLSNNAGL